MNNHLRDVAKRLFKVGLDALPEREHRVVKHFGERLPISRDTNPEFEKKLTFGLLFATISLFLTMTTMAQRVGDMKNEPYTFVTNNGQTVKAKFGSIDENAPSFRFTSGISARGIPFEIGRDNHIFIQARINGSEPLWFILDSGAGALIIDAQRAKTLALKLQGKSTSTGAGENSYDVTFARGASLSLHGVDLFNQKVTVFALDSLPPYLGRDIDGILGYEIFSQFVVEIDYAARIINLYDPQSYQYSGNGESIPITVEKNHSYLRARILIQGRDPIEGRFDIDNGAGGALLLTRRFVDAHKLLPSGQKMVMDPASRGAGGVPMVLVGRLDGFQVGRFIVKNSIAGFSRDAKGDLAGDDFDVVIGGDFWRRFKMIFDYTHRRIILEPNADFDDAYEYDMSGLGLVAQGKDYKTFRVLGIIEDSPASEAGLREGDVMMAIDNKPAQEFTLDQIRQLFMQQGQAHLLRIKRGEKVIQTNIKLRRLI